MDDPIDFLAGRTSFGHFKSLVRPGTVRNGPERWRGRIALVLYTETVIYTYVIYPICSMYGIFTYIWVILRFNVGKYSIHGAYGYV
jgi:hypothetical protein